jgi:mannosyltransferase
MSGQDRISAVAAVPTAPVHAEPAARGQAAGRAPGTRLATWATEVSDAWFSLLAATISLALGLYQLGQPSLWIDESFTARAMSRSYAQLIHEHHWIYYTFMKPWTALAGTSELALRLPSVFATAAACALLVPLGNRLMGRPVGSIAGVVLALNSFVVQWSQQARSYSFVMLFAIAATAALVHLRTSRTRRAWAGYAGLLGALLLLQPLSAGLLAAAHVAAARGFRLKVVAAGITVAILASPFLAGVYRRDSEAGTLVWNNRVSDGKVVLALLELSGAVGFGLVVSAVALVVVRRERLLLGAWAFAPLAVSAALTPVAHVLVDRYLLISAPAFALLVAAALCALRGPWRVGALGVLAVGVVGSLLIWYSPSGSDNWAGQDWKAATRYAMEHGGATVEPPLATPAYTYYGGVVRNTGYVLVVGGDATERRPSPLDRHFGYILRVRGPR